MNLKSQKMEFLKLDQTTIRSASQKYRFQIQILKFVPNLLNKNHEGRSLWIEFNKLIILFYILFDL